MGKKNWAKHDAECDQQMATMTDSELPDDLMDWINLEVLDDEHYIFYDRKTRFAYCTRCQKQLDERYLTTIWSKHNEPTTCPSCLRTSTFKCIGKYRKTELINSIFQFRILQRTTEGIVARRFEVIRQIYKTSLLTPSVSIGWGISELQRSFNDGTKTKRYRAFYSSYTKETTWNESRKETFNELRSMGFVKFIPEVEYRRNLPEVIAGTWLEYAKTERGHPELGELAAWIKPVEYVKKMGLTRLADDILRYQTNGLKLNARTPAEFLQIPSNHVRHFKQLNLSLFDLKKYRRLLKEGIDWPTQSDIEALTFCEADWQAANKITSVPLTEFLKLLGRQKDRSGWSWQASNLYKDYLGFCQKLGYDLTDKSILYPSNIKEAHDREMARVKIKDNEDLNNKILARFEKDQKRFAVSSAFVIRPPRDMSELLSEGSKLQHCVGTYAERVAKNETTILLIRKPDEPDEPYFTAEWRDGRLIQCRGKRNCDPPEDVRAFLNEWQKIKKLNKHKKENRRILA